MKKLIIILSLLLSSAATAKPDQFDAVLHWSSAAAAKSDPSLVGYYDAIQDAFAADKVVLIQVWRPSLDVTNADGTVTHTFMSGVFALVSDRSLILALRNDSAMQVVFNRDKCNARQAGCVVGSNISNALLKDIMFEPVFMGADYPWGGFQ